MRGDSSNNGNGGNGGTLQKGGTFSGFWHFAGVSGGLDNSFTAGSSSDGNGVEYDLKNCYRYDDNQKYLGLTIANDIEIIPVRRSDKVYKHAYGRS